MLGIYVEAKCCWKVIILAQYHAIALVFTRYHNEQAQLINKKKIKKTNGEIVDWMWQVHNRRSHRLGPHTLFILKVKP